VAIKDHLVTKGNVSVERIFLKNDDIYKAPENGTNAGSRVEFSAIAQ
jgi:hypothetical protein